VPVGSDAAAHVTAQRNDVDEGRDRRMAKKMAKGGKKKGGKKR
jgi:hypothetical protein